MTKLLSCKKTRWLSAILLFFVSVASLVHAQDDEPTQEKESPFIQQQSIAMDCELERLQVELGLPKEHFEIIKEAVADDLAAGAHVFENGFDQSDARDMGRDAKNYKGRLSQELAHAIHDSVSEFVDAKAMKAYREDFQQLNEWESRFARKNVVVFLDNYLELRPEQIKELEERLEKNWQYVWNYKCIQMSFNGYKSCQQVIEALENNEDQPNQITELLTDVQLEIFPLLNEIGRGYSKLISVTVEEEAKAVEADLQWFLKRTIELLSADKELNQKQISRLNVGFRGALIKVLNHRKRMTQKYKAQSDLWNMSAVMESPFQQIRSERIWQQTVSGVLSNESKEDRKREDLERQNRSMEIGAVFGISYLSRFWRIPIEETIALYELATEKIVEEGETNIYRGNYVLFAIPDESFSEVLSDATFEAIQPRLSSSRMWKRPENPDGADDD